MARMAPQDEWTRVTLRLPPELHEHFKPLAQERNRSVNAQIVEIVGDWVRSQTAAKEPTAVGEERCVYTVAGSLDEALIKEIQKMPQEKKQALLTLLEDVR